MSRSFDKSKRGSFDAKVYENVSQSDLILFAIYSLGLEGEGSVFARLVEKCFSLFPLAFGFSEYPQWPDARKLDRSLRSLRQRRLIQGDPKTFFVLTKRGEKEALRVEKKLKQKRLEFGK
jgi:hypothetical protein